MGGLVALNPVQALLGLGLAGLVSLAAYRARALNPSGPLAAAALGTVVFGLGGLDWAVLLLAFFISSSALSRLAHPAKKAVDARAAKGSRRDAGQVLANGGFAGLCVLLHLVFPESALPWAAFAGSLAAANADTWATELGAFSPVPPRRITTGQVVERGASGGVTAVGLLAALAGSALIGLLAALFWPGGASSAVIPGVALAGLGGSLVDSLLGAAWQAVYYCPDCGKETERHPRHSCGAPTRLVRGWAWLDNDVVNAACTRSGARLGLLLGSGL